MTEIINVLKELEKGRKKVLTQHLSYNYHSEPIISKAHTWVCPMSSSQLGTSLYHQGCQAEISKSWLIVVRTIQVFINWFTKKASNWQFQVWFCGSVISSRISSMWLFSHGFKMDSVYWIPHAQTSVLRQGQSVCKRLCLSLTLTLCWALCLSHLIFTHTNNIGKIMSTLHR